MVFESLRDSAHLDSLKERIAELRSRADAEEEDEGPTFQIRDTSQDLIVIPDHDNIQDVDVRYPLIEPFADAHVEWDEEDEGLVYRIEEPTLNDREQELFDRIKDALEQKIEVSLEDLDSTEKIIEYLEDRIRAVLDELGINISEEEETKLMYFVYRNFAGLNEIEPLMHDPYIEDIGCSGIGIPTYIVHSKFGSIKTDLKFDDKDVLKNLVVKLAERCGKYVSYANPLLDGSLPDGSRVNASLTQDVTTKGPTFSIRKFQETPYSAADLIDLGTASYDIMAYFWMAMEFQKSILVSGGTATGKTTFLNGIVTFIPPEQKIVSIEDTRELQLPHENWIPSVSRTGFGSNEDAAQNITMYQLLKESFRQNPDYVVVGEVRGKEASVLFQGMSSGHPSLGTIHASSPSDVTKRLTTPPINLSPALVDTLDIIVIMTRARQYGESARRVKAVYEVETITPEGSPRTNEYFSWTPIDDTFSSKNESVVLDSIRQQYGYTKAEIREEIEDRKKVLKWMRDEGYTDFSEVARIVSEYYKDKDAVMKAIKSSHDAFTMEDLLEDRPAGAGQRQISANLAEAQQDMVEQKNASEAADRIQRTRSDEEAEDEDGSSVSAKSIGENPEEAEREQEGDASQQSGDGGEDDDSQSENPFEDDTGDDEDEEEIDPDEDPFRED